MTTLEQYIKEAEEKVDENFPWEDYEKCFGKTHPQLNLDDKTAKWTDYLFKQIEPFLEAPSSLKNVHYKDVRRIIFKTIKEIYKGGLQ